MKVKIKLLGSMLLTVVLLTFLPLFAPEARAESSGIFNYTVTDGDATITGLNVYFLGDLTIPATVDGYSVTAIADNAFSFDRMSTVTIPEGVKTIGKNAFDYCSNLHSVSIPSSVTNIGQDAFCRCESLTNISVASGNANYSAKDGILFNRKMTVLIAAPSYAELLVPDGVVRIEDYAFYWSSNLTSVIIPGSVNKIGNHAFDGCDALSSVTLASGLRTIGEYAFRSCDKLTSVTIPSSVTSIGSLAFYSCDNLTDIYCCSSSSSGWDEYWRGFPSSSTINVHWNALAQPQVTIASDGNRIQLTWDAIDRATKYNVFRKVSGSDWEAIGYSRTTAYTDKTAEAGITYYYKVQAQVSATYSEQSRTVSRMIPPAPTGLAVQNFASGAKLTWNAVDGASKYLVFRAEGDGSFEQIASTANTAYVDKSAVSGTPYRYRVKAKDALFTSPYSAAIKNTFLAAPELTATAYSVNIKLTWSEVPGATRYNIFRKVSGGDWESVGYSRTTYYVDKNAEPGVVYYYRADAQVSSYHSACSAAVSNVLISAPTSLTVQNYVSGVKLSWSAAPGISKYLVFRAEGNGAFEQIASASGSSYVDKTATSGAVYRYRICSQAASFCSKPSATVKIHYLSVPKITVVLTSSAKIKLSWKAVPGATKYNIYRGNPSTGVYSNIASSRDLSYVDEVTEYTAYFVTAQYSSAYSDYTIAEVDTSIYSYKFSGDGATITDFDSSVSGDLIIAPYLGGRKVTALGRGTFDGCTRLTSITIPSGVTTIPRSAFYNCTNLISIIIPSGVTSIGQDSFSNCSSLKSISLPSSITEIGGGAFYGCSSLASITIPSGVETIYGSTFAMCTSLRNVTIPSSVTAIRESAFSSCTSLTSFTIPSSVNVIGEGAFANCTSLTSIIIPSSVRKILGFAFADCSNLTSINIPSSVRVIGERCFANCSQITIYCAVKAKPTGWDVNWSKTIHKEQIHWGVTQ